MDHALPDDAFVPPTDAPGAVVVGLSGGLDSTVLLHRLARQPGFRDRGLRALHVHHGLHPDADAWALHCARLCAELGVALDVHRVDVARDSGLGPEAAARAARHAAFAAGLGTGDILALAHHLDDQAETFLLRALRASGPDGLAAMRPWRRFAGGWMWRPLLGTPRAALRAWAERHGLAWIEDPANADPAHDRSVLRHQVLPLLRARWPGAAAALARSAALCGDAADLLAAEDAAVLDALLAAPAGAAAEDAADGAPSHTRSLSAAALRALPAPRRARVLRAWISGQGLPPLPGSAMATVERMLDARDDALTEYRWSGAALRRWRGQLHAMPLRPPPPRDWLLHWDGRTPLPLPAGGRLLLEGAPAFERPLHVHARRGGERMQLPGRGHTHALKHLLQDAGVPPWKRAYIPLLSAPGGGLLAAGDRLLSARFHDWLEARGARLHWQDMA